jgi:RHS repeat-associated protein
VCVVADDDVAVVERRLLVDAAPAALDFLGCAVLRYDDPATVALRGEAEDAQGNLAFDEIALAVVDPDEGNRPVVDPDSIDPPPGALLRAPTEIRATISEGPSGLPITWEVRLARAGSDSFQILSQGSGEVADGVVAAIDTTLLANDVYVVRIEASNGLLTGGVEYDYSVTGALKPGGWRVSLYDGTYRVRGIAISIARNYDSLDAEAADFGPGFRLSLPGRVTDSAAEGLGTGIAALLGAEPFRAGTRVYVTAPDGRRLGFTFTPEPTGYYLNATPAFTPDPGVSETLEAVSPAGSSTLWRIGGDLYEFLIPYNPRTYVLTTPQRVRYTIDEADGLQAIETANGVVLAVGADGVLDPGGNGIAIERDGSGRVDAIRSIVVGEAQPVSERTFHYDAQGRLVRSTDATGADTHYLYQDVAGSSRLYRIEDDAHQRIVEAVYAPDGRVAAECPADGDLVTLAGCREYAYDVENRVVTLTDGRGNRTDWLLDEDGNALAERRFTDAVSYLEWSYSYDVAGNVTSRTDPAGDTWSYAYDDRGNRIEEIEPGGQRWSSTHDACGPIEQCDPLGDCWTRTYDEHCDLTSVTTPLGATTTSELDEGAVEWLQREPTGSSWTWRFDPSTGFLDERVDPAGRVTTFDVSPVGLPSSVTDALGRTTSYTLDTMGRPATETWNTTPATVFDYDFTSDGDLTRVSDGATELVYGYDEAGRLETLTSTDVATSASTGVSYEHDGNGNVSAIVDTFGGRTEYGYDVLDRLASIVQTGTGVVAKRVEIERDDVARTVTYRHFTGLASSVPDVETILTYSHGSASDRLVRVEHRSGAGATIEAIDLARDAAANVVGIADADGAHALTHDGAWRLVAVARPGALPDESYAYDAVGNRRASHTNGSTVYAYDAPACVSTDVCGNERLEDDAWTYEYDAEGSLVRRTDRATGDYTSYEYDHRNRLVRVEERDVADALLETTEYRYDPANRRTLEIDDGVERHVLFADLDPIVEHDGAGNVLVRRMYGRGIDQVFAEEEAGAVRWLLRDASGSVTHVWSQGAVVERRVWDSFGRLVAGTASASRLGYMGRTALGDLVDFRARYHDASTGRFTSRDPLEPYRYEFLENAPYRYRDPLGRNAVIEFACTAAEGAEMAAKALTLQGNIAAFMKGKIQSSGGAGDPIAAALLDYADGLEQAGDRAEKINDFLELVCKAGGGD